MINLLLLALLLLYEDILSNLRLGSSSEDRNKNVVVVNGSVVTGPVVGTDPTDVGHVKRDTAEAAEVEADDEEEEGEAVKEWRFQR